MNPDTVAQYVREIEAKDQSTAAHTWRVVLYLRALFEELGADHTTLRHATHGAALHDIGKLDIPANILQKPGKLTDEEFEVIKQHTVTGYARMIALDVEDELILDLVRYHHERWDGLGYPFQLEGDNIPVVARLFAVIDTFDALTSVRPYRSEVGAEAAERAVTILEEGTGTHFWPEAVERFVSLYRSRRLDYILEHFNDKAEIPSFTAAPEIVVRATELKAPPVS